MTMAYVAVATGGANLIGGLSSSRSAKKLQQQALDLQAQQLAFAKQRYNDSQAIYGGVTKQAVQDAENGVQADLGGVTSRATGDVASAFANADAMRQRNLQRLGIAPDSGRADALANQDAVQQALTQAADVTTQREAERRNAVDQTFARRQWAANLGQAQMNGDANGVANATSNMAGTYNNFANQDAGAAQGFFAGAGQALGMGLASMQPSGSSGITTPVTSGVPTTNVTPSAAFQAKQSAIKNSNLITDVQSGGVPGISGFMSGLSKTAKIPLSF